MASRTEDRQRSEPRGIRVFISSTFKDMHAEREELVKRVFPQLRRLCEEREVDWSEVDLRWGISEEQRAEGAVLPICLAEIQRCRPYFICMLGERYGWIPAHLPSELTDADGWPDAHHSRSVTELEVLHGALNDPAMADRAFFYFRDPPYLDRLPPGSSLDDFADPSPEGNQKLADLKQRIRDSGLALREDYRDPRALAELVLEDMTDVIDADFPADDELNPLDREAAGHEAFARSRARVYVGGSRYFQRLDDHLNDRGAPLVVLGESGAGKTALLANWAARIRSEHPDALVLSHFVGATPSSADWAAMLRRILAELKRAFGIQEDIPEDPHVLREAFAGWLHAAAGHAGRRPIVLILDALDKLAEGGGALDLTWLPAQIAPDVRVIVSTQAGRPLEVLEERGWPTLPVESLTVGERRELIVRYLARFSKTLGAGPVETIAAAPQASSPLYLRALLEELRLHGGHETLPERIEHYLAASTIAGLFDRILHRWEQDYDVDRPALVRDALSFLWASRGGLSESELLDLLGTGDLPLPAAHWSPLRLAAEESLLVRSGRIGFFHDFLREAVGRRYLTTDVAQRAAHVRLAAYFGTRVVGPRRIDEQPWQLARAGDWSGLHDLLGDLSFLGPAVERDRHGVQAYWTQVEARGTSRAVDTYRELLADPAADMHAAWSVAVLLTARGEPSEAAALWKRIIDHLREEGDHQRLPFAVGSLASVLTDIGQHERALEFLDDQERICRKRQDGPGIVFCLSHQARILEDQGELRRALLKREEEARLCDLLEDRVGQARAAGERATILLKLGRRAEAIQLLGIQERLSCEEGDVTGQFAALGTRAQLLEEEGDPAGALALHDEAEQHFRHVGSREDLAKCLVNRGRLLVKLRDLDAADKALEECAALAEETGSRTLLEACLWAQARVLETRGNLPEALDAYRRQEAICRETGLADHLQVCLDGQAVILSKLGQDEAALDRLEEREAICRRLGDKTAVCRCLLGQGMTLAALGRVSRARAAYEQCERLARELEDAYTLQIVQEERAALPNPR